MASREHTEQRRAAKARTEESRRSAALVLREVLEESGVSAAQLAELLGLCPTLVLRWTAGTVAVPAALLLDDRLPSGLRERLAQRLLGTRRALQRPSNLRVVHVAAETIAALTRIENDNARPSVAELHDECGRWLCSKEAA